jgi:hypothetical protein
VAFVDLKRNVLVLKVVLAGPPKVGKTERLQHIGEGERVQSFGSRTAGVVQMASLPLPSESTPRLVEIEVYEWHGPERADVRAKSLFTGLDGIIYVADAREDRLVDTVRQFEFLLDQAGKSRVVRLPGLLVLGRMDEGTLRLDPTIEKRVQGPTWSERVELPYTERDPFVEAVRLFGEVMLARVL